MSSSREYDFVILGTGMAGLAIGALLANANKRVCLLEAQTGPGGYAHTYPVEDFEFCAQVHYIWGCSPNQAIYQFLKKLDLHEDITFNALNPKSYDLVALPDGKRVGIPYGFDVLIEHIEAAYPGQRNKLKKFLKIISRIQYELRQIPDEIHWWHYLSHGWRSWALIQYKDKTLQDVFNECGLSKEAQAILCADAGDFAAQPEVLSVLAYTSLFAGYNEGAYYPTKHFKYFIHRLADFITSHDGCDIFYNAEVTKIEVSQKMITQVQTADNKTYRADQYICNMDPKRTASLIGWQHVPKSSLEALQYDYSPSSFVMHLGLKGLDLREHGFGNYNIWHLEQWDMNKMWKEQEAGNYDKPWLFLSTSTLHTNDTSITPEGGQSLFIGTLGHYAIFSQARKQSEQTYLNLKQEIENKLIDIVEQRYVPDLRNYIKVKSVGTPLTNETFNRAPQGNCYGSLISPKFVNRHRLGAQSPWSNFYWCNASGGFAGIHGTVSTAIALYRLLTGEQILNRRQISVEKSIAYAKKLAKAQSLK